MRTLACVISLLAVLGACGRAAGPAATSAAPSGSSPSSAASGSPTPILVAPSPSSSDAPSAVPSATAPAAGTTRPLCELLRAEEVAAAVGFEVKLVGPFTEDVEDGCEWSGRGPVIVARVSPAAGLLEGQRGRSESAGNPPVQNVGEEAYVVDGAVVFRLADWHYNVTVATGDAPADGQRAVKVAALVAERLRAP